MVNYDQAKQLALSGSDERCVPEDYETDSAKVFHVADVISFTGDQPQLTTDQYPQRGTKTFSSFTDFDPLGHPTTLDSANGRFHATATSDQDGRPVSCLAAALGRFGEHLRRLREAQRLSPHALDESIDVEPRVISRYERGVSLPRTDTLVLLARALHVASASSLSARKTTRAPSLPTASVTPRSSIASTISTSSAQTTVSSSLASSTPSSRNMLAIMSSIARAAGETGS